MGGFAAGEDGNLFRNELRRLALLAIEVVLLLLVVVLLVDDGA